MALAAISGALTAPRLSPHSRIREIASARFYRPELDLLRFFAFLCVFFHHGLPGFEATSHMGRALPFVRSWNVAKQAGSFGVCLFFVLSAYLITELLERERIRTGTIQIKSFYVRRILRIWPLYFTFLAAGVVLGKFLPAYRVETGRLIAFILLSGNWYSAVGGCGVSPIAPLWSISIEEQFYLAWPWVAKLGNTVSLWRVSLLILPLSWAAIIWLSRFGTLAKHEIWTNSFVQFQFFAIGTLLALVLRRRTPSLRTMVRVGLFIAGLLCWFVAQAIFRIKDDTVMDSPESLLLGYAFVAAGCILFFFTFLGISGLLVSRRLTYLGKISYGLYVFHLLALDFAWKIAASQLPIIRGIGRVPVAHFLVVELAALGSTMLLAEASYKFLEKPFLQLKERFALVESRMI